MFRNFKNIFSRRQKAIEEEIASKSKIDKILPEFVRKEILKNADLDYRLSFTLNKGIIKIETDSKLIAQEIALRIKILDDRLREDGVVFRKVLV